MDFVRESGGVAGSVLITTRFVWPYGGRSVFLSGSFTGFSEHWPMTPVEGCPTVFQTICSLPPGYHQTKHGTTFVGTYGSGNALLDDKWVFIQLLESRVRAIVVIIY
ncbi:unnamed protein product [Ilex paraguariensis]|uniref:AMP-activated protein kinase glycogen-binding domain-containing protein n=1 Tax=Ilex paraguariensis TaxID=185542 RepID=A0ABC8SV85_9AQUA